MLSPSLSEVSSGFAGHGLGPYSVEPLVFLALAPEACSFLGNHLIVS